MDSVTAGLAAAVAILGLLSVSLLVVLGRVVAANPGIVRRSFKRRGAVEPNTPATAAAGASRPPDTAVTVSTPKKKRPDEAGGAATPGGGAATPAAGTAVSVAGAGGGGVPPWEIDAKKLKLRHAIGKGNFGAVYLGTWLGSPVAVKTLLPELQTNEKMVKRFIDEARLMATLHHPNVVLLLGACTQPPNLCIVMEYCSHGSLHDFLRGEHEHGIPITMSLILRFALDIAR